MHRSRFSTTTYPDGSTRIEEYYQDGTLYSVTGSAVHPVRYEYLLASGTASTERIGIKEIELGENGDSEFILTWKDMAGRVTKVVHSGAANPTTCTYDTDGLDQLQSQADPDGVATLYQYDSTTGERESTVLDMNRNGNIDFGSVDRVTQVQNLFVSGSLRRIQTDVFTDGGTISEWTDSTYNGFETWSMRYGLLTHTTTVPTGNGGKTVTVEGPDHCKTVSTYSGSRLASVVRSGSNGVQISKVNYQYDDHGRQWKVTDARCGTTEYTYYDNDLVESVTSPQPGDGSDLQITHYEYDAMGRKITETLPDGGVVYTEYFPTGELKNTHGARTYTVDYTYDSQGRMKTLKTAPFGLSGSSAITTWNYGPATGFLMSKVYADGKGPSYTYTDAGRLLTRQWARTCAVGGGTALVTGSYGYNHAGEVETISYNDGTPPVALTHDRLGRLATVSDASGSRTFTYNEDSQVSSETFGTLGLGSEMFQGLSIQRGYDDLLRRTTLTGSGAGDPIVQSIEYDAASRYWKFSQGAVSATYAYEANSALVSGITFQNSGTTTMTTSKIYDNLNRLKSIASSVGSKVVSSHAYHYNLANQRTRATLEDGSHWDYGYDSLGQVTSGNRTWSGGAPVEGQQFGYAFDSIGNRTSTTTNNRPSLSYTPNVLNQYEQRDVDATFDVVGSAPPTATVTVNNTPASRHNNYFAGTVTVTNTAAVCAPVTTAAVKASGTSNIITTSTGSMYVAKTPEIFHYDDDGNLTKDGRWNYTWDAENRLIAIESIDGTPDAAKKRLEFAYDWQGRRTQKLVYNWNPIGGDAESGAYDQRGRSYTLTQE